MLAGADMAVTPSLSAPSRTSSVTSRAPAPPTLPQVGHGACSANHVAATEGLAPLTALESCGAPTTRSAQEAIDASVRDILDEAVLAGADMAVTPSLSAPSRTSSVTSRASSIASARRLPSLEESKTRSGHEAIDASGCNILDTAVKAGEASPLDALPAEQRQDWALQQCARHPTPFSEARPGSRVSPRSLSSLQGMPHERQRSWEAGGCGVRCEAQGRSKISGAAGRRPLRDVPSLLLHSSSAVTAVIRGSSHDQLIRTSDKHCPGLPRMVVEVVEGGWRAGGRAVAIRHQRQEGADEAAAEEEEEEEEEEEGGDEGKGRQHPAPSYELVHVDGVMLRYQGREKPYRSINGVYRKTLRLVNGRQVYVKVGGNVDTCIWWRSVLPPAHCAHPVNTPRLRRLSPITFGSGLIDQTERPGSDGSFSSPGGNSAWCVGPRRAIGSGNIWAWCPCGSADGNGVEEAGTRPWVVYNYSTCTWEEQGAIVVEGWGQQLKRGASRRGTALETIVFVNWCWDEWCQMAAAAVGGRALISDAVTSWGVHARAQQTLCLERLGCAHRLGESLFQVAQRGLSASFRSWRAHLAGVREVRAAIQHGAHAGNPALLVNIDPQRLLDPPERLLEDAYWCSSKSPALVAQQQELSQHFRGPFHGPYVLRHDESLPPVLSTPMMHADVRERNKERRRGRERERLAKAAVLSFAASFRARASQMATPGKAWVDLTWEERLECLQALQAAEAKGKDQQSGARNEADEACSGDEAGAERARERGREREGALEGQELPRTSDGRGEAGAERARRGSRKRPPALEHIAGAAAVVRRAVFTPLSALSRRSSASSLTAPSQQAPHTGKSEQLGDWKGREREMGGTPGMAKGRRSRGGAREATGHEVRRWGDNPEGAYN